VLTGAHKTQRIALALTFLEWYQKDSDEFLIHIVRVTGDETWVSFVSAETKEQSEQWMHTHSPDKPKKFKQILTVRKLKATVSWYRNILISYDPLFDLLSCVCSNFVLSYIYMVGYVVAVMCRGFICWIYCCEFICIVLLTTCWYSKLVVWQVLYPMALALYGCAGMCNKYKYK
jgi:antibiotic biosynthesis monooxygenase (ABM) superfamily enzyme